MLFASITLVKINFTNCLWLVYADFENDLQLKVRGNVFDILKAFNWI